MPLIPLLAQVSGPGAAIGVVAMLALLVTVIIIFAIFASRYTKVGPNEVLVISGRKRRLVDPDGKAREVGFRIVTGGGVVAWPVFERQDSRSLELLTIDVQTPEVYTSKGVPVKVDGVAQIKIKGDDISIATAAEQFLSKSTDEIKNVAMQTLEGHLRAILGTMTVEEIYQNRDAFASRVQEVAASDMANMGLGIVSVTGRIRWPMPAASSMAFAGIIPRRPAGLQDSACRTTPSDLSARDVQGTHPCSATGGPYEPDSAVCCRAA